MTGFVSFVSAGPGDPELLTLKAVDRLGRADAVLYDDLAAGAILAHARAGADLVGVGKRAGRASPRQDHISRLLVDYARAGCRVVRLKAGDAGIFGRLEEEIAALRAASMDFEIVPGVPSPCAAAAGALMPLTRRLAARRLQFVTGHDVDGRLPADLDLAALADPRAITAVFMARRTFPTLAAALTAIGLPGETPALMVEDASLPGERRRRGTVAGLARHLTAASTAGPPCLILYGPLAEGDGDE